MPVVAPVFPLGPLERGEGFAELLQLVQHDFVKSSKSDKTWSAYMAWMEVLYAWLDVLKVDRALKLDARDAWVEELGAAISVLAIDYSSSTISVFVTAVSYFMRVHKMGLPHDCEYLSALLTGILRWFSVGKHKKPAVEDWHVDQILKLGKTARHHSLVEYCQALSIAMIGWQLFNRP